ncbi:histidinol-phosphatase HisJ family protein [Alkaliphilus hydrothermalis]|uniref:Histidinol-phosphatase n=1 Tax=Alkaliphilus hydrothermalis TaxID=1482730 RepID=A0ABS2NPK1_9FIRM|nr:histidinol-phosphatase HisJ family protein [Alkaliphilus hydrothermalis]MBM7614860.1 histidinol-phosphatase (PHP family) [Alkaliphilus hydrothermalis]
MFDYHVHTTFSPDAKSPMEEVIKSGIEKNLKEICFTDHIDYDWDGKGNDIRFDFDSYFKTIDGFKEKYKDRISIKQGVEFGLQPHLIEKYQAVSRKYDFDFILCSVHSLRKEDLYQGVFFEGRPQQEAYNIYFEELAQVVDAYEDYSVLGHLDVIKRYGGYDVILPLEHYHDFLVPLLKKIIHLGKGLELNTSGIRYNLGDFHPSLDILKIYRNLGGEIVTTGADSHQAHQVAYDFPHALEALSSIGFKYVCTFDKMKPAFHSIEKLLR